MTVLVVAVALTLLSGIAVYLYLFRGVESGNSERITTETSRPKWLDPDFSATPRQTSGDLPTPRKSRQAAGFPISILTEVPASEPVRRPQTLVATLLPKTQETSRPAARRMDSSAGTRNSLVARFRHHGVRLYHFTDMRNCGSIQQLGAILPNRELRNRGISPSYVSSANSRLGDSIDGRDCFVHLAFHSDHKMSYSARSRSPIGLAIYEISLDVLETPGIMFTKGLANKRDILQQSITTITDFDLRTIAAATDESRYWQLLFPGPIPVWRCIDYFELRNGS